MDKDSLFSQFSESLQYPPGEYYLRCEQEELNRLLAQCYGFFLVQAGVFDHYDLKSASTINHRVYVGKNNGSSLDQSNLIESKLEELPFQPDCVDVFFLPHTLELCADPKLLLHEIFNILISGGKLILLGYNPLSSIGMTKLFHSNKKVPWIGKLFTLNQVRKLLNDQGFTIEYHKYFCFNFPSRKKILHKNRFSEQWGQRFLPFLGSVYILVAEKKAIPVAPIRLKVYQKKQPVTAGFPEPSTNKGL